MFLSPATLRPLSSIRTSLRRTLFTFPKFPFAQSEPDRQNYSEEKIFPYNEKELYAVVADISSYPKFIPFCIGSRIDKDAQRQALQQQTVVNAELTIGFMGFEESYVSTVTCIPYKSVQAVASPSTNPLFKELTTIWKFQSVDSNIRPSRVNLNSENKTSDDPAGPTVVKFDLSYQFEDRAHALAASAFFGSVSKGMIAAFAERCLQVYGPRRWT